MIILDNFYKARVPTGGSMCCITCTYNSAHMYTCTQWAIDIMTHTHSGQSNYDRLQASKRRGLPDGEWRISSRPVEISAF